MPAYDYHCEKCDEVFEVWQSMSDEPLKKHAGCGGKVKRVFSPVGIAFKGSGFYKNDHGSRAGGAKKEKSSAATSSESGSSSSSSTSDSSSSSSSTTTTAKKSEKKSEKKSA